MKAVATILTLSMAGFLNGQSIFKLQTNIGALLPSFTYTDASGNSIDYNTSSGSDIRFGFLYKSSAQSSIGLGLYAGVCNISSESKAPLSTVDLSVLNFDLFANYVLGSDFLQSISIGPTIGLMTSQKQTNENQTVTTDGFAKTHFGLYSEVLFGKFKMDQVSANPYVFYRTTLSNVEGADAGSENSSYSAIGLGVKISI